MPKSTRSSSFAADSVRNVPVIRRNAIRGTYAPATVTVSPVARPNRRARCSPANANSLPANAPLRCVAFSNRRKASGSTPRTTTGLPARVVRPRISGLTVFAHSLLVMLLARLTLIDRGPVPWVIAYASPATIRAGSPGRAPRTGHVAPRRKAHRTRPANARGRIRMGPPPSIARGPRPAGMARGRRRPRR